MGGASAKLSPKRCNAKPVTTFPRQAAPLHIGDQEPTLDKGFVLIIIIIIISIIIIIIIMIVIIIIIIIAVAIIIIIVIIIIIIIIQRACAEGFVQEPLSRSLCIGASV